MIPKTCITDCSNNYCPFVQDPKDSRRYVCLKCGLERSLDERNGDSDRPPALILTVMTVIVMLVLI